jgi:threonine dehydratase
MEDGWGPARTCRAAQWPHDRTADIRQAAAACRAGADTPCVESRTLSQIAGCQVFLKFENLQFTASFKERGACNKLASSADEESARRRSP